MYNITIGMDLGDKKHQIHVLDLAGETIKNCQISNTAKAIEDFFFTIQNRRWQSKPVLILLG